MLPLAAWLTPAAAVRIVRPDRNNIASRFRSTPTTVRTSIWAARLLAGIPRALSSMRPSCFAFPRGLILPRPPAALRRDYDLFSIAALEGGTQRKSGDRRTWRPRAHGGEICASIWRAGRAVHDVARKAADGLRLGAHEIVISKNQDEMKKHLGSFDFILDSVSADHDINAYLKLLKLDGTLALVGARNARCPSPLLA